MKTYICRCEISSDFPKFAKLANIKTWWIRNTIDAVDNENYQMIESFTPIVKFEYCKEMLPEKFQSSLPEDIKINCLLPLMKIAKEGDDLHVIMETLQIDDGSFDGERDVSRSIYL